MKKSFFSKTQKYLFLGFAVVALALCIVSIKYYVSDAAVLNTPPASLVNTNPLGITASHYISQVGLVTGAKQYSSGIPTVGDGKGFLSVSFRVNSANFNKAYLNIGSSQKSVAFDVDSKVYSYGDPLAKYENWQYIKNTQMLVIYIPSAKVQSALSTLPSSYSDDYLAQSAIRFPNVYTLKLCKDAICSTYSLSVNKIETLSLW